MVFTSVPNDRFDGSSLARYLAQALGAQAVLPEVANLETYDDLRLRQRADPAGELDHRAPEPAGEWIPGGVWPLHANSPPRTT